MLTIGPRDTLTIHPVGPCWVVRLTLAPAHKPYAQPDDLCDALTHFARLPTHRDAVELRGRILAAGTVDERYWLWVPREAGRFGGVPVARPERVESFKTYRHAPAEPSLLRLLDPPPSAPSPAVPAAPTSRAPSAPPASTESPWAKFLGGLPGGRLR